MLPPVECSPCYPSRVLALEEEGFGLAVLEAEDLAIATDVEFALSNINGGSSACAPPLSTNDSQQGGWTVGWKRGNRGTTGGWNESFGCGETVNIPCPGISSRR